MKVKRPPLSEEQKIEIVKAIGEPQEEELLQYDGISSDRINHAVNVLEDRFNLTGENYSVTGFKDKGNTCIVSLSNSDFDLTVTIKDTIKYDI